MDTISGLIEASMEIKSHSATVDTGYIVDISEWPVFIRRGRIGSRL